MTATGLYILAGRYAPVIYMDNIEVSVDKTEANTPTVTLTGINNAQRVYTIGIQEDETLHLSFNGKETTVNYSDTNEGSYTWSNNPNYDPNNTDQLVTDACEAGTLKAWTTLDNLKSDEVTVDVTNNIITLPTAAVDITNVTTGYAKTYHATCDNSNTPLAPTIYGTYKFTGKDGSVKESSEPTAFPFDIAVDQAGSLEITSQAFGYGSAQTTVENNVQYAVKEACRLCSPDRGTDHCLPVSRRATMLQISSLLTVVSSVTTLQTLQRSSTTRFRTLQRRLLLSPTLCLLTI